MLDSKSSPVINRFIAPKTPPDIEPGKKQLLCNYVYTAIINRPYIGAYFFNLAHKNFIMCEILISMGVPGNIFCSCIAITLFTQTVVMTLLRLCLSQLAATDVVTA